MHAIDSSMPTSPSHSRSTVKLVILAGLLLVLGAATASGIFGIGSARADAPFSTAQAAGPAQAADKIAPDLRSKFSTAAKGVKLQYWVIMADQADTTNTIPNSQWAAKGWYVYNTLTQKADSTQAPLLAQLAALQNAGSVSSYQGFWIINSIMVTGDLGSAQVMAAQAAVARVTVPLDGVVLDDSPPGLSGAAQGVLDNAIAGVNKSAGNNAPVKGNAPLQALASLAPLTILHNINEVHAPQAWDMGYDGTGITVGSMDTGVRWTHEALNARYRGVVAPPDPANIHDYNWFDGYNVATTPVDNAGHGSHTMGTMIGTSPNRVYGNVGVAKGAQWITVRTCGVDGSLSCDAVPTLSGFQWILAPTRVDGTRPNPAYRPRVASNSWGSTDCTASGWQTAVTNWVNAGIFPDFAAGNEGPGVGTIRAPASYANAWGTGNLSTVTSNWAINVSSSRGPGCFGGSIRPQAVAPGTNICSSVSTSDTAYDCGYIGTSMATPHIAGAVAVLLQKNPDLTIAQVEFAITSTAFFSPTWGTVPNNNYGWGLLQVDAALNSVPLPGTPTPTITGTPPTATRTNTPTTIPTATTVPTTAVPSLTPTGCVPQAAGWNDQTPYPDSIEWGGMAAQNHLLYSFGGYDGGSSLSAVYSYDPNTDIWAPLTPLPDVRFLPSVVSDGRFLYILNGGDSNGVTHIVYRYDPVFNAYTGIADTPTGVGGQVAVYLGGKIYSIGGCTTPNCTTINNAVYAYTISSNSWAPVANYPIGVVWSSVVAYNGYIYTAGAAYVGANQVKTYRYDPNTNTWDDAAITDLLAPRDSSAFGLVNGQFVLAGGRSNGVVTDAVTALDLSNPQGDWQVLPNMTHAVYQGNGAGLDGHLYAVGGTDSFGLLTSYDQRYSPAVSCPTDTPSATSTATTTTTATPQAVLVGHLTWQGISQPNIHNTGITATLDLCVAGSPQTFVAPTDSSGYFTLTLGLPSGQYNWQTKGVRNLGNAGSLTLLEGTTNYEFGLQGAGDASNNNVVNAADFGLLKNQFGQGGTGKTGDFNNDGVVNGADFSLLKGNFGQGGSALTCLLGGQYRLLAANRGNRTLDPQSPDAWLEITPTATQVALTASITATATSTLPPCGPAWRVVSSPNVGTTSNALSGVAAISSSDVWAVGSSEGQTLIEHWDGASWSVVPSPNTGTYANALSGVAAVSSNDVWAVGFGDGHTLAEHWDGTSWSIVQSPVAGASDQLNGVAAVSGNDVWAVGSWSSGFDVIGPLIEHWDGTWWNIVPPASGSELAGVAAVSSNDVWAVGSCCFPNSGQTHIEHWNGSVWSVVSSPNVGIDNYLRGVAAISTDDVWAVGDGDGQSLIEHWDGASWSVISNPNVGSLNGIAAVSTTDVWAVGYHWNGSISQTVTEHWNGVSWSVVYSPNVGTYNSGLTGVAVVSASDIWAVGKYNNGSVEQTLAERYNDPCATPTPTYTPTATLTGTPPTATGTPTATATVPPCAPDWRVISSPDPYIYGNTVLNAVAVISSNDVWAVGYYIRANAKLTLIEHWDGSAWSVVASPSPNMQADNVLNGVAAVSSNDVWAVGSWVNFFYQTLIEHWDGSSWSVVSTNFSYVLNGVAAVSSNDVWAVGTGDNQNLDQPLIVHWNGTTWSVVSSPNVGTSDQLNGVAAVSSNDVWAVGSADGYALIEHWDGNTWGVVPGPNLGNTTQLSGVAAVSSNDVWAVGYYWVGLAFHTLVERWDGSAWSIALSSNVGTHDNYLYGVVALGPNDWWAVGKYNNGSVDQTLIIHSGAVVSSPNVGTHNNSLNAIAEVSGSDVWAVGTYNSGHADQTLVERYNPCPSTSTPTSTPMLLTPTPTVSRTSTPTNTATVGGATHTATPEPSSTACPIQFTDVPDGSTFYTYIRCLACRGIVSGYTDGTYRPNNNITRDQLSKIVSNSAGFNDPQTSQMFQDVPPGSTFFDYIGRLASRGYINGYSCGGPNEPCVPPDNLPYFRTNNNATRGQITKIVSDSAGFSDPPAGQIFEDVPPGSTFYTYTQRLATRSIMQGYACGSPGEPCVPPADRPYFRPNNNATRGQTSKIVANTFFPGCQTPQR